MVSDPFPKSSLQLKRYTMVYPISDTPVAKFVFRDGNNHPDLAIKTHPGHANSWDKSDVDTKKRVRVFNHPRSQTNH